MQSKFYRNSVLKEAQEPTQNEVEIEPVSGVVFELNSPNKSFAGNASENTSEIAVQKAVRKTGTVAWFNDLRGYGFIEEDGAPPGVQVFVHWRQIWYEKVLGQPKPHLKLEEGQRVEFEVRIEESGRKAYAVVVLPD